ncbi:GDP-mannose 4,6-dehydratase [Tianweitania populi]|uniref:GDP-6-deoxy-D-lyxo-4-hexulose reductase n=1 Tax=Tianweitania populi TaxID=1607949 RepID=A0A8J3DQX8_9HYPH|nr:GDP-mannose 4,6-dehydratase [Tianweitania populi]GHD12778.1 GDP-6-deoxy-D-lyxo-4-hexulose reductase [Tianweitania populi]
MTRHRLLVTGLQGFVGTVLTRRVQERPDAADITLVGLNAPNEPMVDIRDADAVKAIIDQVKPTALIHLAAIASPRDAANDPAEAWAVNVMGTFNLAHALRSKTPDARLIFAGSSEAYGATFASHPKPLREDAPLQPTSVYGATKAAADLMLGQMAREGLNAIRFRPFNHTGPGQAQAYVVSAFARQIVRIERGWQEPVMKVGNLEAARDFMDVRDVVDAYLIGATGKNTKITGAFNLATGSPIAIQTILDMLIRLSESAITVEQDPGLMRASEVPVVSGDASAAQETFGWKPVVPLAETLTDVLNHWRAMADTSPDALR